MQNNAVQCRGEHAGFSETKVWSGQPGRLRQSDIIAIYQTCYPPAVNYSPLYYLINGVAFDKTNLGCSLFCFEPGTSDLAASLETSWCAW